MTAIVYWIRVLASSHTYACLQQLELGICTNEVEKCGGGVSNWLNPFLESNLIATSKAKCKWKVYSATQTVNGQPCQLLWSKLSQLELKEPASLDGLPVRGGDSHLASTRTAENRKQAPENISTKKQLACWTCFCCRGAEPHRKRRTFTTLLLAFKPCSPPLRPLQVAPGGCPKWMTGFRSQPNDPARRV